MAHLLIAFCKEYVDFSISRASCLEHKSFIFFLFLRNTFVRKNKYEGMIYRINVSLWFKDIGQKYYSPDTEIDEDPKLKHLYISCKYLNRSGSNKLEMFLLFKYKNDLHGK